jgi:uncharacterized damage-inducible protein DinB
MNGFTRPWLSCLMRSTAPTTVLFSSQSMARSIISWSATASGCKRITGEGDAPTRLDAILYEDFAGLRAARAAEDARIIAYVGGLTEEDLGRKVRYRTISRPADIEQELVYTLPHVFNHQTHHRGQVHALLTRIAQDAPSLDLILYQRETGIGLS